MKTTILLAILNWLLVIAFSYLGAFFLMKGFVGGEVPFFSGRVALVFVGIGFSTAHLQRRNPS